MEVIDTVQLTISSVNDDQVGANLYFWTIIDVLKSREE
jgi:hypothetical protein